MGFIEKAGSAFHSQLSAGCQIQLIFIDQRSNFLKLILIIFFRVNRFKLIPFLI
jgi:hypothetical protein